MLALFYKDQCKGKGNSLMENLGLSGACLLTLPAMEICL